MGHARLHPPADTGRHDRRTGPDGLAHPLRAVARRRLRRDGARLPAGRPSGRLVVVGARGVRRLRRRRPRRHGRSRRRGRDGLRGGRRSRRADRGRPARPRLGRSRSAPPGSTPRSRRSRTSVVRSACRSSPCVAVAVITWRRRRWTPIVLTLIAAAGSLAMTIVGKDLVDRARPPAALAVPAAGGVAVVPERPHAQRDGAHDGRRLPRPHRDHRGLAAQPGDHARHRSSS